MTKAQKITSLLAILAVFGMSACGGGSSSSLRSGGFSTGKSNKAPKRAASESRTTGATYETVAGESKRGLLTILGNSADPNVTIEVNKYIWNATLEVLDFLPIQAADPFTGIISTGYGTPPGGGRAYKATIYIQDPALDARSLNISLRTRSGVASADTVRAVEDAILTRARQLRIRDSKL